MNILDEITQRIRASEKAIERDLTYEEVCAELVALLHEIIDSPNQADEAKKLRQRLAHSLYITRRVAERDPSLEGVASSLHHLICILDTVDDPTSIALEEAMEATLLDVQFCISQHE